MLEPSCEGFWRPVDVHCPLVTMSTNSYAQSDHSTNPAPDFALTDSFLPSLSFVVNPVGFLLLQSCP